MMTKKKPIIFLDFDGVICLNHNWGSRFKKLRKFRLKKKKSEHVCEIGEHEKVPIEVLFDNFDKKSVKILNQILDETGAEIVVSSDWRLFSNLEDLGYYFISQGIIKKPIDFTKKLGEFEIPENFPWSQQWDVEQTRCLEIHQWLKEHPEVTNWVAIDDLNMSKTGTYYSMEFEHEWGLENFIHTPKNNEGLKQSGVKDKIIKLLKNESSE